MHPKRNIPSEYVKTSVFTPKENNPLAQRLNATGLDLDDLASSSGVNIRRLKNIINGDETPTVSQLYMLDLAFEIPQGTLKREFGI